VSLRKVWIAGNLPAIRRAHYLILELFVDSSLMFSANQEMGMMDPLTMTAFSQNLPQMMMQHQQAGASRGLSLGLGLDHHSGLGGLGLHDSSMLGKMGAGAVGAQLSIPSMGGRALTGIPLTSLGDFGLQEQTVRQLVEMRGYLLQHVSYISYKPLVPRLLDYCRCEPPRPPPLCTPCGAMIIKMYSTPPKLLAPHEDDNHFISQ
jgi:hypothetical protein